jgi:hypothetical protein
VLKRLGLGRPLALYPKLPAIRCERAASELIHIDTKKFGRIDGVGHRITGDRRGQTKGIGWDVVRVCVDDAFRLANTEVQPEKKKESAGGFLARALAFLAAHRVSVEPVTTDNASAYRKHAFRDLGAAVGLRHIRTRPTDDVVADAVEPAELLDADMDRFAESSRLSRRTGSAGLSAVMRLRRRRLRIRLTVAGELPTSAAVCLPVQRWRRSALTFSTMPASAGLI